MKPAPRSHDGGVLGLLADGQLHSGEELARALGITRAGVWKRVGKLESLGVSVQAKPGRGYRLTRPIDLLDSQAIRAHLDDERARQIRRLEVFAEIDSTNRYLLGGAAPAPGELTVCLAEFQRAGRGRRGKFWSVPFGGGLCLSAGWTFDELPPDLAALTLAVGVVVRRVLLRVTGLEIALKWPNDLLFEGKKLGGILLELAAESQGPCHVVVGVGINVSVPSAWLETVADPRVGAVDLYAATGGVPPTRSLLAARLIEALAQLLAEYAEVGFSAQHEEFIAANYLFGRCVTIEDARGSFSGKAVGVDTGGALIVETANGNRRIICGEVSVRPLT